MATSITSTDLNQYPVLKDYLTDLYNRIKEGEAE
jgi:hypothetical protein